MSQLVEECYFDKIEVFYLIVGHTHNILDQWFSVLSKAIRAADFIGSVLALHTLYKFAHDDDENCGGEEHEHNSNYLWHGTMTVRE